MRQKLQLLVMAGISLVIGLWLFGANFDAKLGVIDDHQTASYLGPSHQIKLRDFPKIYLNTEVGEWGKSLRYRPTYYLIRVAESMIWKDNAWLWYATNMVLFVLTFTIVWNLLSNYLGYIPSLAVIMYSLSLDYWKDIWTRLGPGEIYAVPGLAIFFLGISKVYDKQRGYWPWILVMLGFVLCVGSKENFFFLYAPLILAIWQDRQRLDKWKLTLIVSTIFYGLFILSSVMLATLRVGKVFYGDDLALGQRALLSLSRVPKLLHWYHTLEIAFTSYVVSAGIIYTKSKSILRNELIKMSLISMGMNVLVVATIAFQIIIYGVNWPNNTRYDFPGMIAIHCVGGIALLFLWQVLRSAGYKKLATIFLYLITFLMIALTYLKGYYPIQATSRDNADRTTKYQELISDVSEFMRNHPESSLVFESDNPVFYEQIASTRSYMQFKGLPEPMYLHFDGNDNQDALYDSLSKSMRNISINGISNATEWGFASYLTLPKNSPCVSLVFGEIKPTCQTVYYY